MEASGKVPGWCQGTLTALAAGPLPGAQRCIPPGPSTAHLLASHREWGSAPPPHVFRGHLHAQDTDRGMVAAGGKL